MAVVTLYMSDRDESKQFTSKKEADDYDKKLELGSSLGDFLNGKIESLSEELAEEVGMLLAEHKDLLIAAFKKPSVLTEQAQESSEQVEPTADVTKISDAS